MKTPPSIAVLLTCFNRREKTLASLRALAAQERAIARSVHVILVDDGSRDGTAAAVSAEFPQVELLHGTGSLYWNGGMRLAFGRAQQVGFDYYLLLNDDTVLVPHCLDTLLETSQQLAAQGITSIVTAAVCDPDTGLRSYGGMRRERRWNGIRDLFLEPDPQRPSWCDAMNGNCALIPSDIAKLLGNLDPGFSQQFGDYDYGFRATRAGFGVHIAPGYLGTCANNPVAGTWRDPKLAFKHRWKHLLSPKGAPPREWLRFAFRHYGYLWPLYFLSPYLRACFPRPSPHPREVRYEAMHE